MTPLAEVLKQPFGERLRITGLVGGSKAYFLSRLLETERKKGLVYFAPTTRDAVRIRDDLKFFGVAAHFFPPHDALPFSGLSPHLDISCQRIAVLDRMREKEPAVFVSTPAAVLPLLPPPTLFEQAITLSVGEEADRDLLVRQLTAWGYQKVTLVTDRGTFAVRGGLIDLYPPSEGHPVRLEWAGDLAESLRHFDSQSQKSLERRDQLRILPAREVLLTDGSIRLFQEKIRQIATEKDLPKPVWGGMAEKVKEGIFFSGIESYLPLLYDQTAGFWDYAGDHLVIADDPALLKKSAEEFFEETATIASSQSLLSLNERLMEPAAFLTGLEGRRRIELLPFAGPDAATIPVETHENLRGEIDRTGAQPLAPIAKKIRQWLEGGRVVLVCSSETQAGRLSDLLGPYFGPSTPFETMIGDLSSGFRLAGEPIAYLTDEEIFGPHVRRVREGGTGEGALSSLAEIKPGDPLVHKQHGIGLYRGMIHMTIEGVANDFLLIEYRGGDKLYLPVYRLNLVQRYTGSENLPHLDKLGGTAWLNLKKKAEKQIREMAGDLLNLYAARTAGKGFAFSPSNDLFEQFEAGFPFEETPDQEKAIADTLADMRQDRPMDRLILGDVGYGKTEVAMRAAYQAALDGKQTAILVPTTLLAFQHFERFGERFHDTPARLAKDGESRRVRIEMLSRFRSAAEQKKIVRELREGKIDILIGTHRLLQPDLSFKDLGLLVIDEEHRFGVGHKEKIKQLRKNVDALTLSATPIPRTLYMSMVGIRGVSVIETPPTDRLAVRTYVMPFQEPVIREAIGREIHRGGQLFFVHNRVETIQRMKEFLAKLVPEAKLEIAHGQMKEEELEGVMLRFYHGEFNLLLCSTIIESGIDIPTANTILIGDAQNFGLAQIYQLRGRVGRGPHRAFCYLLVPEEKELTPEAVKRLQVLQRFSELGTGFRLASYDLEIRGAGNLLGREQSGQMTAIGFELYTDLLEKAVRELKGETVLDDIDPELHFKLPAFIPEDYLPDPPLRLELYRRLSALSDEEEIEPVSDELRDRFGKLPPEVENLLEFAAIRTYARRLRIKQIRFDGKSFSYAFDPTSPLPPEFLMKKIAQDPKRMRLTPDFRLIVQKPLPITLALAEAKRLLRELALRVTNE